MVMAVKILGIPGNARHAARFLGQAHGVANLGRALPAIYAAGWPILDGWPEARLVKGAPTNALVGAIGALGDDGYVALLKARERARRIPRQAAPATAATWQSGRILDRMRHPNHRARMFDTSFESSEARRRLCVLSRAVFGGY